MRNGAEQWYWLQGWWHGVRPVWGTPHNSGAIPSPVLNLYGVQVRRGVRVGKKKVWRFVRARNMAMVTVAPADSIAAMNAADD